MEFPFRDEVLYDCGKVTNLKLIYRASLDGFEAWDFHRKCNNQGATLILVKTKNEMKENIYGGYTDIEW